VAPGGLAGLAGYPAFMIDVALDSTGNVYAADATGGRLLKWTTPFAANSAPAMIVTILSPVPAVYIDGNVA
jgi:hypothetical protein